MLAPSAASASTDRARTARREPSSANTSPTSSINPVNIRSRRLASRDVAFDEPVRAHRPGLDVPEPARLRQREAVAGHGRRREGAADEERRDEDRRPVDEAGIEEGAVERAPALEQDAR